MSATPLMMTHHFNCHDCGTYCATTVVKGTFDREDEGWVCPKCAKAYDALFQWEFANGFLDDMDNEPDEE